MKKKLDEIDKSVFKEFYSLLLNFLISFRDIYYEDVKTYGKQSTLDAIVVNISHLLKIPRWDLHIVSSHLILLKCLLIVWSNWFIMLHFSFQRVFIFFKNM